MRAATCFPNTRGKRLDGQYPIGRMVWVGIFRFTSVIAKIGQLRFKAEEIV